MRGIEMMLHLWYSSPTMEREWEIYKADSAVNAGQRVHVTLNRRGNFYLNVKALEALGGPETVVLMYDRRASVIGMARASYERRGACRLKKKDGDRSGGRVIYAANFCRKFGINPEKTLSFVDAAVDKNGILLLDLQAVRGARGVK
jgi:hypothetical protein